MIEGKPHQFLVGDTVINFRFQFGIGVNMNPLLNQKAFEKKQRMISVSAFVAFIDAVMFHMVAMRSRNGQASL